MSKKVVWSQRIRVEERDFLDEVLENYRVEQGLKSKGEALVHFIRSKKNARALESHDLINAFFKRMKVGR